MTQIYLVQHGKAFPKNVDKERRLTDEGIKETKKMATYLMSLNVKPDKIVYSKKTRAKMTAIIFAEILNVEDVSEEEGLAPLDDPRIWAAKLYDEERNIMVVGHLPHLSRLASLLLNTTVETICFIYSGVLCLKKYEDNRWKIKWFLIPDIIK